MSFLLYRLGLRVSRRPIPVIAAWLIALVMAGGGALLFNTGTDDTFSIPNSESQDSLEYLSRVFPEFGVTSAQMVAVVPQGQQLDTPTNRTAVNGAVERIRKVRDVVTVVGPFDKLVNNAISRDQRAGMITIMLRVGMFSVDPQTKTDLKEIRDDLAGAIGNGATVDVGGDALSNRVPGLTATEAAGVLIALVVLLVMFGSFIVAGMPLVTALIGVGVSASLVYLGTLMMPISAASPLLAVMLGLAVGIDYALFLLSRHRDQLEEGMAIEESIARATATAGSAVVFAGCTVIIAMAALAVANIPFLTVMALSGSIALMVAVTVAITLIPALMALVGERMRPRAQVQRSARRLRPNRGRLREWWLSLATRHPVITIISVAMALSCGILPAAGGLQLALPDNGAEAPGTPARDTYDTINAHFDAGYNGPLLVSVDLITSTDPIALINNVAEEIRHVPGVALVPLATPDPKGQVGIIMVIPKTGPDSQQTEDLVHALRQRAPQVKARYDAAMTVTGITAACIDVSERLAGAMIPFGILVVGLSMILLAIVFRSLWVPLKAMAGYLLSLATAFGATGYVFQQGHFANLLNIERTGSVISFFPIIVMGSLFGLSMDYEVFLVSRIREEYVRTGDPLHSLRVGFFSSSRVVTAAAIIMIGVFAAFVPDGNPTIKPIAFGLAVGVFTDAFLVRMTLHPAILALLGHRTWQLWPWLDRALPVLDVEGDSFTRELELANWPAPDCTDAIAARGLCLDDDRGRRIVSDVDITLPRGDVLALHGSSATGKSALLYALAGRVKRPTGDLKVLGRLLPQHTRAVRSSVALVACREAMRPARDVAAALAQDVELVLIDDADLVVEREERTALRQLLAQRTTDAGNPVSVVLTCQDPDRLADLLPADATTDLALPRQSLES